VVTIALAGDTMLGRNVGRRLLLEPRAELFSAGVMDVVREADLLVVNLECAVSDRGRKWVSPDKLFFFRAPPVAVEHLVRLGVGCVTLANNHALDYGPEALLDTLDHLRSAGVAVVGAGADLTAARAPALLDAAGVRVGVVGVTDHPADFAAGPGRPGVAYADLRKGVPPWLLGTVRGVEADVVLVSPHWGPNMVADPVRHVRAAAHGIREAGATLVAGHSAHVFHGVQDHVLFDLGDFVDDYASHRHLHNELGLLFLVTVEQGRPVRLEAVPLALDYCHTRLANPDEARWVGDRFRSACAQLGTDVTERRGRLVITWDPPGPLGPREAQTQPAR